MTAKVPRLRLNLLLPQHSRFNLRLMLTRAEWRAIQRSVRGRAHGVCEICGAKPDDPLHVHEEWDYDDDEHVRTLAALQAVCSLCHRAIHFGQASWLGYSTDDEFEHLCKVNGWSAAEGEQYIEQQRRLLVERQMIDDWEFDESLLEEYGFELKPSYGAPCFLGGWKPSKESIAKLLIEWESVKASRSPLAIFFDRGYLSLNAIEIPESNAGDIIRNFTLMRHQSGTAIGIYTTSSTRKMIEADLRKWFARWETRQQRKTGAV